MKKVYFLSYNYSSMNLFEHLKQHLPEDEINALEKSLEETPVQSLFLNPKLLDEKKFLKRFPGAKKHPFLDHTFYFTKNEELGKNLLFDLGAYYIQDASASLVPYFLSPQKEEKVFDMCASPGGKSVKSSLLMENTGLIVANDNNYLRSLVLSQNVERFGLINVVVTNNDLTEFYEDYENYFDKVLLDAPCSGSGMIRKEPKMLADWSLNKVNKMVQMQRKLLQNAIKYVKEGGIIAYSTCSFSYEENEAIILEALQKEPVELIEIASFEGSYSLKELPGSVRLHPNRYAGEGQFICLLRKKINIVKYTPRLKRDKDIKFELKEKLDFNFENIPYFLNHHGTIFGMSFNDKIKYLKIIRQGLELAQATQYGYIYHHGIIHYLPNENSLPLTFEEAEKYIRGEEITINQADGWYIVEYEEFNLGLVRIKNERAKNYYPKGLRRNKLII